MTRPIHPQLLSELKNLLKDRFSSHPTILEQHSHGESWHPPALPDGVCFVRDTTETQTVIRLCREYRCPIIPFGAGTCIEGQVNAIRGGISLDFSQMNRILAIRPDSLDCTIEPGVTREQLNQALKSHGLFFPVDPGANATLGGMAATRATGTTTVRYGGMRENVLSLKVINSRGEVIQTGTRARKSAAGYDLTRLFIGSEGTLGVISELTLKLYGIPESMAAARVEFPSLHEAVHGVVALLQTGVSVARIELLDETSIRILNQANQLDYPEQPTLFLEFHGLAESVDADIRWSQELLADFHAHHFQWASTQEDRNRLWHARHHAYLSALALHPGCKGWVTDVCVPIPALASAILETQEDLAASNLQGGILGHVGDGNFHVLLLIDPGNPQELAAAETFNERLIQRAHQHEGTCTGEHGIGLGKQKWLVPELGEAAVATMKALKQALDTDHLFNPGKLVD